MSNLCSVTRTKGFPGQVLSYLAQKEACLPGGGANQVQVPTRHDLRLDTHPIQDEMLPIVFPSEGLLILEVSLEGQIPRFP